MQIFKLICVAFFTLILFVAPGYSQDIDLIDYMRFENPPNFAELVGLATDNTQVSRRINYSNPVQYHSIPAVQMENYRGVATADEKENTMYMDYTDSEFRYLGIVYTDPTYGTIDLFLNPPLAFDRLVSPGELFTKSSSALIPFGPLQLPVMVNGSIQFHDFETLSTPAGTFNESIKAEIKITVLLSGVVMYTIHRNEWYHPSAGVVKIQEINAGRTAELSRLDPPITSIQEWTVWE